MLERVALLFRQAVLGRRTALGLGVAIAFGLSLGILLVPVGPRPGDEDTPLPRTLLLGHELRPDDGASKVALGRVRSYLASRFTLELPDGGRRELYLGELGAELDKVQLAALTRQARDRTSPLVSGFLASGRKDALTLPVPVGLDHEAALQKLRALKDELDRVPIDARLDLEQRSVVKETVGHLLDLDASLLAIETALELGQRSAKLAFFERRPRRVASELGAVSFGDVLGFFETRYDRSERYEARTYNLRLAASKIDGYVLLPGEVFDFNAVVGARDEASGYKVAPVIAQGELVDGVGGGTCQISGTLHGAAFFAGLEILERYPHTRPSSYIKLGLDATVVYPTINFRMRNPFSVPVVLHQTVKNGIVRAEVLGPKRTHTVTLIRRILEAMPYEEIERPDPELPHGARALGQRGVPGFKLRRYRIVRDGQHAVRQRWDDVYPPTTQIIRVGAKDTSGDEPAPKDDPHPEYLADELLIVTQGPESDDGERVAETENREPGRFGTAGWTEAAGMPYYRTREEMAGKRSDKSPEKKGKSDKPR
jgi:vancomycin resistance protein YoaR